MRAGIAMREADATDLAMYLRVLAQAAKHDDRDPEPRGRRGDDSRVVELRRGFIDDFWG